LARGFLKSLCRDSRTSFAQSRLKIASFLVTGTRPWPTDLRPRVISRLWIDRCQLPYSEYSLLLHPERRSVNQ